MKIGLIARADDTGLGVQTHEFYKHMQPHKTLVVDISNLNGNEQHPERYPDATFSHGMPSNILLKEWLTDLDIVFTCEIPYNYNLFTIARERGIKTVLQCNFEFLDYLQNPNLPLPDLLAPPTLWRFQDIPYENKAVLPVPIATEHFATRTLPEVASTFIHIIGKPAVHDRNGTHSVMACLQYVTATIKVIIKCQDADYVRNITKDYTIPDNVTIEIDTTNKENYWDNYTEGDVLLMPRRYGGLCLPVNEALGAGLPVIMTNIDPNNTWLTEQWLVQAQQIDNFMARTNIAVFSAHVPSLAKKIDQFATDPEFYSRAKSQALKYRERQSWDTLKPVYEHVFKQVIEGKEI